MTRLEIYPDGVPTIWWKNFCEYRIHHRKKMAYEILADWGCRISVGPRDTLEFDNDQDATVFLLKWS